MSNGQQLETLDYRLPWRLEVDPEEDEAFDPGIRFCKIYSRDRHYAISHGWEHPHIYQMMAAAPDLFEALRILTAVASLVPGTHGLALDNARAALAKATGAQP